MRQIRFISLHPDFIAHYFNFGIFASARDHVHLSTIQLRDFAVDHRGSVDDRPFGGGDSMVIRPEPIRDALATIPKPRRVILLSPAGQRWTQSRAQQLAADPDLHLVLICGRFAGVDQRAIDLYVDEEWSLGDFVLSGGELPALAMIDSILRWIPGVIGDSAQNDSFAEGCEGLLEAPLYTRPPVFEGREVPKELLSGHHQRVADFRRQESLKLTQSRRPDLLGISSRKP